VRADFSIQMFRPLLVSENSSALQETTQEPPSLATYSAEFVHTHIPEETEKSPEQAAAVIHVIPSGAVTPPEQLVIYIEELQLDPSV
jgi:hypothetical protein